MAFSDDLAARDAIKTRLQTLFAANGTYGPHYTGSDGTVTGADVVTRDDEPEEPESAGKPYIKIDFSEGSDNGDWMACDDRMRGVSLTLTATANDYNGGLIGTTNPTAAHAQMKKDLESEFDDNYAVWRDLGIYDVRVIGQAQAVEARENGRAYRYPSRLTFVYEVS